MNHAVVVQFIDALHPAFHDGDPDAAGKAAEAENVRRLQEQYRALARGDYAGVLAHLADDIELEIVGRPEVPFTGRWQGLDQVRDALQRNFALVEDQRPEVQTLTAQGDTVVVVARERGRLRATGREYDLHWVQLFTFRDGKVVRIREIFDSASLLEALRPRVARKRGPRSP
jgi:ketosteroid isomerase-like protein